MINMNEAKVAKLEAISELIDNEKQQVMEALAENLCTLRKVVGLTQDDLAQRVGVTRQSI
jgi:DNA-binding transcriptional regulator LsrR (DeoR family)